MPKSPPPPLFPKFMLAIGPSLILIALRALFGALDIPWSSPLFSALRLLGGLNGFLGWIAAAPFIIALLERAELKGTTRIAMAAFLLILAVPFYILAAIIVVGIAG